ncbi:bifunctional riboflavin kinase/FAD synthetase [Bacillus shivajii]|uniref:bifunctional riboflavin kinase/FAD synthetase n=1 Tax=Bacillus shivajii TaxID=1983719 RepID=UPI001CFA45A4|nr:bifunctional riboflavin kinase/FAD synthetase [Bacillus shivajii]UCZ51680.1 bifunctional riboflavin kinase/FAD synthetase [Bacillus shivajii]
METIYINHPHEVTEMPSSVLALGFFDGVHKGHQKVILTAKEEAEKRNCKSGVMTFFPHPKEVLRKGDGIKYLTSLKKKAELIDSLGVDYLIIITFDHPFSELNPQQFVDQYLIDLNVQHVVAGFDYTYGRLGKGTMETLPFHSRNKITSTTIAPVEDDGEKISSTRIRQALRDGKMDEVNHLLGRRYETHGVVVKGEQRGRTIGFPTANVQPEEQTHLPAVGVYAVEGEMNGERFQGVCNIGFKPTFHNDKPNEPTIEVHIFNFDKNVYGEEVTICWFSHLRGEKKFQSVDDLIKQIKLDVSHAREFFKNVHS